MPSAADILTELIALSRHLGDPAMDYAILGEGNSSAGVDEDSFFVKASGAGRCWTCWRGRRSPTTRCARG